MTKKVGYVLRKQQGYKVICLNYTYNGAPPKAYLYLRFSLRSVFMVNLVDDFTKLFLQVYYWQLIKKELFRYVFQRT